MTGQAALATLATLAVGVAGGAVFQWIGTPLPWLLGSLVATFTLTQVTGYGELDMRLRNLALPVMGVLVGSSFNPDIFSRIAEWPVGIAAVLIYMSVSTILGAIYLRKVLKFDFATSVFAAPPGGLGELLAISINDGVDQRRIVLCHSIRIALVVMTVPLFMQLVFGVSVTGSARSGLLPADLAIVDWTLLGGCAVGGYLIASRVNLPGGAFFAALILSAAVHLTGLTYSSPPQWLIAAAQVLLGSGLGVRFKGLTSHEAIEIGLYMVLWVAFLLAFALALAWGVVLIAGGDIRPYFLSLAPGGFSEMLLVTLALGVETAFVATCHIIRLISIVVVVPFAFRLIQARRRQAPRA